MNHTYKVGQVVEFRDQDAFGKSFDGTGTIQRLLPNGNYIILNEKCEPRFLCEVEPIDVVKRVHRGTFNWIALILTIVAIFLLAAVFVSQISNPTFLIATCLMAGLCVIGAVLVLARNL